MTSPFITEEAVKAVAISLAQGEYPDTFEQWVTQTRQRWQRFEPEARAALLAALPHIEKAIREQCAAEIKALSMAHIALHAGEFTGPQRSAIASAKAVIAAAIRARKE